MKRYIIYARRKGEKNWSEWTTTDDINQIEKHVDRVRELGYESKILDVKIESYERKLARGNLLETSVHIGQTVYAITDDLVIETWEVKALHYDGKTWFAIDDAGLFYEVGSRWCLGTLPKANKVLEELTGGTNDDEG